MKVEELNSSHVGKYVTVIAPDFILCGYLTFVEHGSDYVDDMTLDRSKSIRTITGNWTSIQVGSAYCDQIDSDSNVTVSA